MKFLLKIMWTKSLWHCLRQLSLTVPMFSNKASVDNNVIIVTHVEVVHQGPTDECLMILAHLWTWDILHHNKNFYDHGIQESFEVRKQICFPEIPWTSKLFKSELICIVRDFWEFQGIPRKLGIQFAISLLSYAINGLSPRDKKENGLLTI